MRTTRFWNNIHQLRSTLTGNINSSVVLPHHFTKRGGLVQIKPKHSLIPALFIELFASSKESERWCICVLDISIVLLSKIYLFDFRMVPFFILSLLDICLEILTLRVCDRVSRKKINNHSMIHSKKSDQLNVLFQYHYIIFYLIRNGMDVNEHVKQFNFIIKT
jgi:hypothetical protein